MANIIGIKIANGEFYPIVQENSSVKKRLVLTTVYDNQISVQIDLYRNSSQVMAGAQYIGSLVVDNIGNKPKGEPSIEMVISSSENGDIIADAVLLDRGSKGEHQVLSVSLKAFDEANRGISGYDLPDFIIEESQPPSGLYEHTKDTPQKKAKRPLLLAVIMGLILSMLLFAVIWFFFLGGREMISQIGGMPIAGLFSAGNTQQQVQPAPTSPVTAPPVVVLQAPSAALQVPPPVPPPVFQTPAALPLLPAEAPAAVRRAAPVASYRVPAIIPREGAPYTIRYGDTLWDISEAFYRTPWLYPRIARFNNISDPNHIVSGRTIRVPPRN